MTRTLEEVLALLETIAPLNLAEEWDNVGLLVEPEGALKRPVSRVFLTIDLSESVLDEALTARADLLVAYHPPLFRALKRLRASAPEERVIVRALEASLPVYSPHTALDATTSGVNDWLARGIGAGKLSPLTPHVQKGEPNFKLVVFVPRENVAELRHALATEAGAGVIGNYSECAYTLEGHGSFFGNGSAQPAIGVSGKLETVAETRLEMLCTARSLPAIARVIAARHPYEEPAWDVYPLAAKPDAERGAGRLLELDEACSLTDIVARLKPHLGVSTLRVAASAKAGSGTPIRRVALCAGAGGSLFESVRGVDLFVTGEMRHHDVLAKVRAGASVILSEHTHTERGFLHELSARISALSHAEIQVSIARTDADPLRTL